MAADQDVDMSNHYSSSPELSSLPSDSPSEPGSPSRLEQRRTSIGHKNDEIVVDATSAPRFSLLQPHPPHQSAQPQPFSLDGVRLTKDGIPRKKPGRKPGTVTKKAADGTAAASSSSGTAADPPKLKRARKSRDPNMPPVPRKKRAQQASTPTPAPLAPRSISSDLHFQPKIELTSMRMDIDSRPNPPSSSSSSAAPPPARQHLRQPPLSMIDKMPKRESIPNSMQSILNADDPPPPRPPPAAPASTTPVRSVGQNYDPVRSSTYDPVRETMLSRDPYGTGPLGSPRAPTQVANRASASPSIASLVDPAPVSLARSPIASSSITHQVSPPPYNAPGAQQSRYRDSVPSLPPSPSPSPAIRAAASSSSSSSKIQSAAAKTKPSPQTAATGSAAATVPSVTSAPKSSSSTAKTASAKSETNGTKSHSRPPPPPPGPASAKSTSKSATKSTSQKSAAAKAASANGATASESAKSKTSGPATTSFRDVAMTGTGTTRAPTPDSTAPLIKKFSSILHQGAKQGKMAASATSSPKLTASKDDALQPSAWTASDTSALPGSANVGAGGASNGESERSILDFGKAMPGETSTTPSIVLHIPLVPGQNNKYVNFMRLAEDLYGWDALHPRLAAHRDRKARIAAASAALERNGSGRESGDEMTDDLQSGDEGSNDENGMGENGTNGVGASGPDDTPAKPVRKKRIFKEDEYDKDDDFVDDSELLWEEQAAASRDGFFVYSGPLVPEEEKPAADSALPAKRRGGGRGSRGGASRTTGARSAAGRSAGGAGSRGGNTTRKPRVSKQEKEQREREKADSEKANQASSKSTTNGFSLIPGANPPFSAGMAVDA